MSHFRQASNVCGSISITDISGTRPLGCVLARYSLAESFDLELEVPDGFSELDDCGLFGVFATVFLPPSSKDVYERRARVIRQESGDVLRFASDGILHPSVVLRIEDFPVFHRGGSTSSANRQSQELFREPRISKHFA